MREYENYTLAPVPWIEKMPLHWKLVRGKYLYQKMRRPTSNIDEVVTCFRDGTVTLRKNRRITGFTESLKEIGYQGIKKGDLVIHVMDAFAGSIGVSDSDGKGTPVYNVCQAKGDSNNQYYALLLREMARTGFIQSLYRGIRERSSDFRFEVFAAQFYPVPPRPEQDQIVRFLDWKVSSINRLINIKCRKIKELNALKKAIVNSAVTHGLTPNVPMKSSGVKWLGDIPAHWQISRIKRHFTLRDERNVKKLSDVNLLSVFSSVGVIPRSEVDDYSSGNKAANADGYKIVHCGDIVVNIILCWMGALGKSDFDGVTSPAYDVYKPDETVSSKYYHYLFRAKAFTEECYKVGRGIMSMRWRVYSQQFMNINIPIPPSEEQQKIVEYLDRKCMQIDASIGQIEESVAALQELKKCLVADIVTGKIDVRDFEVPAFEYVEETADSSDEDDRDMGDASEDEEK